MTGIEAAFPALAGAGYLLTSPPGERYNCLAWAAGDPSRWWWPDPVGTDFWPDGVPREETLAALAAAYATLGYAPSASPELSPGVQKVAVYAKEGRPTHAARQLPSGRWTSKLGSGPDIEHDLAGLEGAVYGAVSLVLERDEAPPPA